MRRFSFNDITFWAEAFHEPEPNMAKYPCYFCDCSRGFNATPFPQICLSK